MVPHENVYSRIANSEYHRLISSTSSRSYENGHCAGGFSRPRSYNGRPLLSPILRAKQHSSPGWKVDSEYSSLQKHVGALGLMLWTEYSISNCIYKFASLVATSPQLYLLLNNETDNLLIPSRYPLNGGGSGRRQTRVTYSCIDPPELPTPPNGGCAAGM